MFKTMQQWLVASAIGVAGLIGNVQAGYADLVFFGDSISDTGNVRSLTIAGGSPNPFPSFPGALGRFSNGPVWTEYLAAGLGFPDNAKPSNLIFNGTATVPIGPPTGGQNFSFGGARTLGNGSAGPGTGLFAQLLAWDGTAFTGALTRAADPDALYVVLAGANDLRDARSNPTLNAAGLAAAAAATAENVKNVLALLAQAGARHFLISSLPDLGKTPEAVLLGKTSESTAVTLAFNTALGFFSAGLDASFLGFGIDLDIRTMDFYGLNEAVMGDALNNGGAKYGITNVSTACINPVAPGAYFFPGSIDINCGISAYSDPLHPSAAFHRLIGQLALNTAIPEPGSMALVLLGVVMVAGLRRRSLATA